MATLLPSDGYSLASLEDWEGSKGNARPLVSGCWVERLNTESRARRGAALLGNDTGKRPNSPALPSGDAMC